MYKRITIIHRIALCFFLFSLALDVVNDAFLKNKMPREIIGYLIFLTLGFYVGFHICLDEVKRMEKKESDV